MFRGDAVPVDTAPCRWRITAASNPRYLCTPPPKNVNNVPLRRGVLSLWTMFAMSLVGILAFTVIHLWLYADTLLRARHCCESAALAAGYAWLSDDMLRFRQQPFETDARMIRATESALQIAEFYGGRPTIPQLYEDDVRFEWPEPAAVAVDQALIPERIEVRFHEALHTPASGWPWGTSAASADIGAVVSLENQPIAFRPGPGQTLPMLPLALPDAPRLNKEGTEIVPGYWTQQVEDGEGLDEVAWHATTHQFVYGPDGLPEITLTLSANLNPTAEDHLVPVQFRLTTTTITLADDILTGLRLVDLQTLGKSELAFPTTIPVRSLNSAEVQQAESLLQTLSGRAFLLCLCTLATEPSPTAASTAPVVPASVTMTRPVAVRLVDLQRTGSDALRLRFQPCVLACSQAVTATDATAPENRYVYSVRLVE